MLTDVPSRAAVRPWDHVLRRIETASPETILLVVVTIVGATVRLVTLGTQSYWADEAATVHEIRLSLGAMLHAIRIEETTPPLYFVVAWLWAKIFGTGETGLRLLSALLGTALIPVAYLCARELVSRWAGVVAAALVAVCPFTIYYSQEARSYALFAVFCAASFLLWIRCLDAPGNRRLAWWAVWSSLAILTHFFAGFLVAPEAATLLLRRVRLRSVILACLPIVAAQAAVLPWAAADTSHPLSWISAFPLSLRIQQIPVQFGLGALYQSAVVRSGLIGAAILAAVVTVLLIFGGSSRERRAGAIAAGIAACVILVPILLAALGRDYVVPRNLTPAWIPLAVLLAAACAVPRARASGAMLAIVILGGFLFADVRIGENPQYQRPDWRGVARALGSSTGTRAIVTFAGNFGAEPLAIYLRGVPWLSRSQNPVGVSEIDVVGNDWQLPAARLPPGMTLLASHRVDGFLVWRYVLARPRALTPAAIGALSPSLLTSPSTNPTVLLQHSSA